MRGPSWANGTMRDKRLIRLPQQFRAPARRTVKESHAYEAVSDRDDAHRMMAACKTEAAKNGWNVAIAIVDDGGAAFLVERLDGAGGIASDVALAKARTAAVTKRPTKVFEDRVKERPGFVTFPTPGILIQGGLPIIYQGECVGAIGVSGVQSHEDEQIAKAGIDALSLGARGVSPRAEKTSARCKEALGHHQLPTRPITNSKWLYRSQHAHVLNHQRPKVWAGCRERDPDELRRTLARTTRS